MLKMLRVRLKGRAAILAARVCPRRFIRQQDGAVAVEFGLVVLPFFGLMFAIIETALVMFAGQALETAVADSAREIMTGQADQKKYVESTFRAAVCAKLVSMFSCTTGTNSGLYIDVKTYTQFSGVSFTSPLDKDGNLVNNFGYQASKGGDIVVVRFMYPWPIYASIFGTGLANMADGKRLLVATAAFRNEPF